MITLTINGTQYQYPETGDQGWGPDATEWAEAVTNGMLQKAGGSFILLSDVDFGSNFGLSAAYYKSRTSDGASTGNVRLARPDTIAFRNEANDGDLLIGVNASNQLTFNGDPLGFQLSSAPGGTSLVNNPNGVLKAMEAGAGLTLDGSSGNIVRVSGYNYMNAPTNVISYAHSVVSRTIASAVPSQDFTFTAELNGRQVTLVIINAGSTDFDVVFPVGTVMRPDTVLTVQAGMRNVYTSIHVAGANYLACVSDMEPI